MADFLDKIRETLRHCKDTGDLVEVYDDDRDLDHFIVGRVESVTHDAYALLSIGPHGDFDGRQIGRIEDIIRISTGSSYLSALRLLHEARGTMDSQPVDSTGYTPLDLNSALRFAKDKRIVISLIDGDHIPIIGFVNDFGSDYVEIRELRKDGEEDGLITVHLDDIIRVDAGGRTEQARAFLHRVRMGL
jgi:hypothetical protein